MEDARSARGKFIQKIAVVLFLQFKCIGFFLALFYVEGARDILLEEDQLVIILMVVYVITIVAILLSKRLDWHASCNVLLLTLLTVSSSYMTALQCFEFSNGAVIISVIATTIAAILTILVGYKSKFDSTKYPNRLVVIALMGFVCMVIARGVWIFMEMYILNLIFGILGSLIMLLLLFYSVQTIAGGREKELGTEYVVYGTMLMYVSTTTLFRFVIFSQPPEMQNDP